MCERSEYLTPEFWDRCFHVRGPDAPGAYSELWLHCDPHARLRKGDEVVVRMSGKHVMLLGKVESRFPNMRRRLRLRVWNSAGDTCVDRTFGRLPDKRVKIEVGRVAGKTFRLPQDCGRVVTQSDAAQQDA